MGFARRKTSDRSAGRSGTRHAPTWVCTAARLCLRTAAAAPAAVAALAVGPADGLGSGQATTSAVGPPPDTTPATPGSPGSSVPGLGFAPVPASRASASGSSGTSDLLPGPALAGRRSDSRDSTAAEGPPGLALLERPWEAWARDGAALASLLTLDRPVRTAAQEVRSDATEESAVDRIADRAEWFGDWESSLPWIVGGSLAVGQLTGGNEGLREAGALLAGGAAASMVNETVNRAVGRGRPSWEEGAFSLDPFRGHASFPSGHTAYVFGVASGIDVVTDGWVPAAAAYGVASLTGLSRIYHDKHWLTDVVTSAALSTVVSRLMTQQALGVLGLRDDGGGDAGEGSGDGAAARPDGAAATAGVAPGPGAAAGAAGGPRLEPLLAPYALGVSVRF